MKSFLSWVAFFALTLFVGGCADMFGPEAVSQKGYGTYKPYYPMPENRMLMPTPPQTGAGGKPIAALLLPLSGKNAALGQAMLNAAQQAVFDVAGPDFHLLPRDTAAAGGAEGAARAAIASGARIIIGPVFASEIPAVKLVAQVNGLMMLPLSTDTSLADRGVYVMGLAPNTQVERVVAYATARGARNFAALVPLTPYGRLVGEVFRRSVLQNGNNLVGIEFFDPEAKDLDAKIANLAAQRPNIEALFLPESDKTLKTIADKLADAGFDSSRTYILGTGLWDVPGIGKQSKLLVGALYAAPDPAPRRRFVSAYTLAYGKEPPRLATLAYDATALAAVLSKRGGSYDEPALTNANGFAGLDGIFRLTPAGGVERGMAVNEVMLEGTKVVDPAPTSFMPLRR